MSKLQELVKEDKTVYLTRPEWGNDSHFVTLLGIDYSNNSVTQYTWIAGGGEPHSEHEDLTIQEALADNWEPATENELRVFDLA